MGFLVEDSPQLREIGEEGEGRRGGPGLLTEEGGKKRREEEGQNHIGTQIKSPSSRCGLTVNRPLLPFCPLLSNKRCRQ